MTNAFSNFVDYTPLFLQDRFVEFEIKIDPQSILPRIMSVREKLADEFAQDLDVIITTNNQSKSKLSVNHLLIIYLSDL